MGQSALVEIVYGWRVNLDSDGNDDEKDARLDKVRQILENDIPMGDKTTVGWFLSGYDNDDNVYCIGLQVISSMPTQPEELPNLRYWEDQGSKIHELEYWYSQLCPSLLKEFLSPSIGYWIVCYYG